MSESTVTSGRVHSESGHHLVVALDARGESARRLGADLVNEARGLVGRFSLLADVRMYSVFCFASSVTGVLVASTAIPPGIRVFAEGGSCALGSVLRHSAEAILAGANRQAHLILSCVSRPTDGYHEELEMVAALRGAGLVSGMHAHFGDFDGRNQVRHAFIRAGFDVIRA